MEQPKLNESSEQAGSALPFIIYNEEQGYHLTQQAEDYLSSDSMRNQKLAVMSVCGKYRTGKSFLMNKIILEQEKNGFQVGPTVNPCTKGLWIWNNTLEIDPQNEHIYKHQSQSKQNSNQKNSGYDSVRSNTFEQSNADFKVLLIDTEGFGGIDEGEDHDSKILLFSLLLSSYLVYNSLGNIDENAIQQLALIINLAKEIRVKTDNISNEEEDLGDYLPSFMWVVRDFALKLEDSFGNPITQKDYLEKALETTKGVSDQVEQKNRIRRLLKMFFRERDCSTLVRPSESEKDIQNLGNISKSKLRKEFVDQCDILRSKLFKRIKPKMMNNNIVTGGMLCEMAKSYIQSINTGSVPNIESTWNCLLQSENENAIQSALARVDQENMDDFTGEELKKHFKDTVLRLFREKAIGSKEEQLQYINILKDKIQQIYEIRLKHIKQQQEKKIMEMFSEPIMTIQQKIESNNYIDMLEFKGDIYKLEGFLSREQMNNDQIQQYMQQVKVGLYQLALDAFVTRANDETYQFKKIHQQHIDKGQELQQQFKQQQQQLYQNKEEKNQMQQYYEQQIQDIVQKFEQESLQQQQQQQDNEQTEIHLANIAALEDKVNQYEVQQELQAQEFQQQSQQSQYLVNENKEMMNQFENMKDEIQQKDAQLSQQEEIINQMYQNNNQIDNDVVKQLQFYKEQIEKEQQEKLVIFENFQELEKESNHTKNESQFYQQQLSDKISLQEELMKAIQRNIYIENHLQIDGFSDEYKEKFSIQEEIINKQKSQIDKQTVFLEQTNQKIEKQREYKLLLNKAVQLQCNTCMVFIKTEMFKDHIQQGCQQQSQYLQQDEQQLKQQYQDLNNKIQSQQSELLEQQQYQQQQLQLKQQQENEWLVTQQLERQKEIYIQRQQQLVNLHISINQTMVKESSDKIRYTEFSIQMRLPNGSKWTVNRKYKHFCQLYQDISQQIINYRFPESAASIIKTYSEIKTLFSSERPTVIEERRDALQTFLRDLLKDDQVRTLKCYSVFLELENVERSILFHNTQNSQNNSLRSSQMIKERVVMNGGSMLKTINQSQHTQSQHTLQRQKNTGSQSFHQHTQPEHNANGIKGMIDLINKNTNSNQYMQLYLLLDLCIQIYYIFGILNQLFIFQLDISTRRTMSHGQ